MMRLLLLATTLIGTTAFAESELSRLPLHYHVPGKKILALPAWEERDVMPKHFADIASEIDYVEKFNLEKTDLSPYYAIFVGSNKVDEFSKKDAEVFQPVVDFVKRGGHLFLCGSFNGRNLHVAKPLGLSTRFNHGYEYVAVPNRTEVLFAGSEDVVPDDRKVHSYGTMIIDRPYISMLSRGEGAGYVGHTKLATWAYGRGRVSATMIEPHASGLWMLPIFVDWIRRGAPTVLDDVRDSPAEVDPITLCRTQVSNGISIPEAERMRIRDEIKMSTSELDSTQLANPDYAIELAEDTEDGLTKAVAFEIAAQLAADQAEPALALALIERASRWAYVDLPEAKVRLLQRSLDAADSETAARVAESLLEQVPWFESIYRFDLADQVALMAADAARETNSEYFIASAGKMLRRTNEQRTAFESQEALLASWKEKPADPLLLTDVGCFLAFGLDDWELGLDCLAKCGDLDLRELAYDTSNLPDEPALVVRLGDRWRQVARNLLPDQRDRVHAYVRGLYRDLGDGLRDVSAADRRRATEFLDDAPSIQDDFNIELTLDGYGLLTITRKSATWETKSGIEPTSIMIGGHEWKPVDEPFANKISSRFVNPEVDFKSARMTDVSGRGIVRFVERSGSRVVLRINDLQVGESDYEVRLSFGDK